MIYHFDQMLLERTLKLTKGKPPQERADALNLVQAIIEGEMLPDAIVNAVLKGKGLPKRYKVLKAKR